MMIQPYLMFDGRCEEASLFYVQALGARVEMTMRMDESPEPPPPGMMPPGSEKKIMHMALRIGESLVMMSDGPARGNPEFKGITLSVAVNGEEEADRVFNALADGGQVHMPIGKTFWSPRFGMVADRFGVSWMVNMEA
ncbi:MAG: 3-demethylubiquinone-9 3-methyltransferase [Rhizobacter sp.]|nr:3-demethylubiquinone-9 3-methyltransferase [Rhizobacter sp.]